MRNNSINSRNDLLMAEYEITKTFARIVFVGV
jgi:hypothetical protein